ncbi:MAG: FtsX-like permease family protein [Sphingomicrobium sp.]
MSLAWRLARADLRGGWSGLGLMWLCLAIAVAGLAAVTSLSSSIDRGIAANGRGLLGGDLMLVAAQHDATPDEQAAIAALGRASKAVTLRAMIVTPSGESALAELSAAGDDWPAAGSLSLEPGGRRPRGVEIALDPLLAKRLGLAVGGLVRLGGKTFTVSGLIAAMPRGGNFALAPIALVDPAGLAASGLVQPGSLTTTSYRIAMPAGTDPDAAGTAFQRRFADAGWRSVSRNEAGAGTRRMVDRLGDMLQLLSLAALAIGAMGIASAAAAFAATRRERVAIHKLVGASRSTMLAMLSTEVALIAGLAIIVGLAVGAAAPALVGRLAGDLLPVAPDPAPQWAALALSALFGALATVAASWTPLAEAVATRPARLLRGDSDEAAKVARWPSWLAAALALALAMASASNVRLAVYGIGALVALALLFAGIGWLLRRWAARARHRGGPLWRLGVAALDRPGAATVRLAVSLGLGLSLLVALAASASSLLASIDSESQTRAPALFLLDVPKERRGDLEALARRTLPGADIRLVPSLRGPVVAINGHRVVDMGAIPDGAWILRGDRGLTFAAELPAGNRIVAGQWWPAGYRGPPLISIDVDAAKALGLKVGDRMTIAVLGRPIEARIASLRQIDWRSLGFNFAIIFDPATLAEAPFGWMASVSPPPGGSTDAFERGLSAELPMASAIRIAEVVAQVERLLRAIEGAVRIGAGFALLMGVVVLAGAVVATRASRQREIVLLRLVGATRRQATVVQGIEFALIAGVAALAAAGAGIVMAFAVSRWLFDLPFRPGWIEVAAMPLAAALIASLAALLAAQAALRIRPAAGLRTL